MGVPGAGTTWRRGEVGRHVPRPHRLEAIDAMKGASMRVGAMVGARPAASVSRRGLEHCPPPDPLEAEALAAVGLRSPVRLACQLRPTGDIRVEILIPTHDDPDQEVIEAREEDVAVVFSDIRGFTEFAETNMPFDVCSVLNSYFDVMGVVVERHGGQIVDYLGDGLMTLFNPLDPGDPSPRAVSCAIAMRKAAIRFGSYVRNHFAADLSIGIAIHRGPAVVGNLGYSRDRQLNEVGDVLNVVSRIEALNKECATDVLVSEAAAAGCRDLIELGRCFELPVRGRKAPIVAYEVLGRALPVEAG